MTPDAWTTIAITAAVFVALARDLAPPDLLFLGATAVMLIPILGPF